LPWGPPSLMYNWYRLSYPGSKAAKQWSLSATISRAEVKERVELHFSRSGPPLRVLKWILPLPLPFTKTLSYHTETNRK